MRWDPFREGEDLFRRGWPSEFRRLARPLEGEVAAAAAQWAPSADVSETDKEFVVHAELPGVAKEDIKVAVEQGMLTISGERRVEKEDKGRKFHRVETFRGSFSRSFGLPDSVDVGAIFADTKDGVLNVHLPKKSLEKPRPVEIKVQ
ncbi:MAG: Hsp20/alpha crystallin family protein [Steroidobacteraceae bacterium]|jgi:HSP20 family protein|nr:Hsp20/alpha crystallin family protein [Steroidobacteraceae bacterium]